MLKAERQDRLGSRDSRFRMATPGFDSASSTMCLIWHILKLPHFLQCVKLRYILSPDTAGVKVLENVNIVFSFSSNVVYYYCSCCVCEYV